MSPLETALLNMLIPFLALVHAEAMLLSDAIPFFVQLQGRNHGQLPPMMRQTWMYVIHGGHVGPR